MNVETMPRNEGPRMTKVYAGPYVVFETPKEVATLLARFLAKRPGWQVCDATEIGVVCLFREENP